MKIWANVTKCICLAKIIFGVLLILHCTPDPVAADARRPVYQKHPRALVWDLIIQSKIQAKPSPVFVAPGLYSPAQQIAKPAVTITQVYSDTFPQVTAHVIVTGEDGSPLVGLQTGNFALEEDGNEISPTTHITVTEGPYQNFDLVLALDTSVREPDIERLAQITDTIQRFIGTLDTQDRIAIVTFHNEVDVVQDFSNDQELLKNTIGTLNAQSGNTALNEAFLVSAKKAAESRPGHSRAVVILTNSINNINTGVSAAEAITQAIDADVPVYIICYKEGEQSQVFDEMTRATGGRAYSPSDLGDSMRESLSEITSLLRHRYYEIVFRSKLPVDNAEHDLVVQVENEQGQTTQAVAHFVAVSRAISVTMSSDVRPQMLPDDVVILTASVGDVPAPPASVTYWLDDLPLSAEALDIPPYNFEWSIPDSPGSHQLYAQVQDSIGNVGSSVPVALDVVLPVTVSIAFLNEESLLGEMITVTAQVTPDRVSTVEFLLDEELLGLADTAISPYSFSFTNSKYVTAAGTHTITVRVVDKLNGQEHQDSSSVNFVAPEPDIWPLVVSTGCLLTIGFVVAGLAFVLLTWWERKRHRIIYPLKISNLGNVESRYELLVTGSPDAFKFEFNHDDNDLSEPPKIGGGEDGIPQPATSKARRQSPPSADLKSTEQTMGSAKHTSRALADWLSNVIFYVPPLGKFLSPVIGKLRQAEQTTRQFDRAARKASMAGEFVASSGEKSTAPTGSASQVMLQSNDTPVAPAAQPFVYTRAWIPPVKPGENLMVDLKIVPPGGWTRDPLPSVTSSAKQGRRTCSFKIQSISVEQPENVRSVKKDIHLVHLPWFRRFHPLIVSIIILVVAAIWGTIALWAN